MNGARGLLAVRPTLRGRVVAVDLTLATIVLMELVRRLLQAPILAPGALMVIAVVASTAGMRLGLLSAAIFTAYGAYAYADGNVILSFTPDGALRLGVLAGTGIAMALLVGLLKQRAEQQQAADLAREGLVRQRMVTETTADAIVTIDEDSTILFANPATARIFGYAPGTLPGTPLTNLMPEILRPRHVAAFRKYLETSTPSMSWHAIELTGRRSDGSEFPVEVSFAEFPIDGGRSFTGTIRDISERKQLETQLVEAQRMEAVGRMAGAIAHDFNNILTAVSGYATLVKDQLPENDPAQEDVDGIVHAADGATSLVRQLLAFSRRQVLHPQVVDLAATVEEIMPMIGRLIGERVAVDWRPPATPVTAIEADPTQLDQVIMNLVLNARDAMPDGGTITIEVADAELDAEYARTHLEVQPGPYVMLAVSDTGVGMDRETVSHVFEPFYTTKSAGRGTGLGLATVYGIVKQSKGSLAVYSEPGLGSTFRVYFPQVAGVAASRRTPPSPDVAVGGQETILLAEDEASVRELVRTLLSRLGYRVLTAADGLAAVDIAERERIDLLLTDVIMPGLGGPEVAARVRELHPKVPILFMSGYTAGAIDRHNLIEQGAVLLQKPFTPAILASTVREALGETVEAHLFVPPWSRVRPPRD
jgi:PAS domain S-box-containing protein